MFQVTCWVANDLIIDQLITSVFPASVGMCMESFSFYINTHKYINYMFVKPVFTAKWLYIVYL